MKQRRGTRKGSVQGHALLYGRTSRAIRIVNGEKVEVERQQRPPKRIGVTVKQVQKKYVMDENTKRRLDNLKDPLDIMSRNDRAKKYEATSSDEKYEYGLSDW